MITFYKTPTGQALLNKMPAVLQNTMVEMQQLMQPMMQRMRQIFSNSSRLRSSRKGKRRAERRAHRSRETVTACWRRSCSRRIRNP